MDTIHKVTPEKLKELQATNPKIEVIETPYGEAAFAPSDIPLWDRYMEEQQSTDPGIKARAFKVLVYGCLVCPERPVFDAMIAERPGLIQAFGKQLIDICGLEGGTRRKK